MPLTCLDCGVELINTTLNCPTCRLKNMLIVAVQMAYRKHVLDDDRIGWDELSDRLQTVLCESLGDPAFQSWLATVRERDDQ